MYSGKGKKDEEDGLGGGGNPFAGIQKVRSSNEGNDRNFVHDFEQTVCHYKVDIEAIMH